MKNLHPFNFHQWIDENRHLLKPPVGNRVVFQDSEFIVMVVGGPNSRTDYHDDPGDEIFYQLEGDMLLKTIQGGKPVDITIRAGDMLMLPGGVLHSPRRPANTVGLVIERVRRPDEVEGFVWFCERCHHQLHAEYLHISNIETQLPPVFERFYADVANRTCTQCGQVMAVPSRA